MDNKIIKEIDVLIEGIVYNGKSVIYEEKPEKLLGKSDFKLFKMLEDFLEMASISVNQSIRAKESYKQYKNMYMKVREASDYKEAQKYEKELEKMQKSNLKRFNQAKKLFKEIEDHIEENYDLNDSMDDYPDIFDKIRKEYAKATGDKSVYDYPYIHNLLSLFDYTLDKMDLSDLDRPSDFLMMDDDEFIFNHFPWKF